MVRPLAPLSLVVVLAAGCGSAAQERTTPPRLRTPFVSAPESLMRQCRSTARAVGWPAPCPTRIPRRLKPTQVIGGCRDFRIVGLPPCRRALAWRGWIVGSSEVTWPREHLVIQASPRPVLDYAKAVDGPGWYKGARVDVGRWVDVDGLRARWVFVPPAKNEGSAFAGHVVLVWTKTGHTYAVGFHDTSTRGATRAMDLELVRHLRLVGA